MLVDTDIKYYMHNYNILENYLGSNINSISVDVRVDKFVIDGIEYENEEYELEPNSFIYIKTIEKLNMPNDLVGKIIEKNSLMRKGLVVDGPLYQPGHSTYIYLRVRNINKDSITLKKNMAIGQICFIKLDKVPNITYDNQIDAKYNNEFEFRN